MRQVVVKAGAAVVEETPAPQPANGRVLVRTRATCISVGTELSGIEAQRVSLWKRALRNPDKVARALRMMAEQGINRTLRVVKEQQTSGIAVGYSAAGEILDIGSGIDDLHLGQRVACAGAGYAMHADVISVPRNLLVPVDDSVSMKIASTVTLGAIALQGIRRLQPTLGETFIVFGLGILGQITSQILKANGCRVIGIDLDEARIDRALDLGADFGFNSALTPPVEAIHRLSNGLGVDGVIVTAATSDQELLNTSFAMCRPKGRVVLVGDVPITIDRSAIYRHELEFLISTSYGPGRYDTRYEEKGQEYPLGYVRWSENRNMQTYLNLIAEKQLDVEKLLDLVVPIHEAPSAYHELSASGGTKPLAAVLLYDDVDSLSKRRVDVSMKSLAPTRDSINVGLVGASAFARTLHLPNIAALSGKLRLTAVCSGSGHLAKELAEACEADYATTSLQELLDDPGIDLILIAGRHSEHAEKCLSALRAGKHVMVEKPLAINESDLRAVEDFYAQGQSGAPVLMTGFNRRFSPAIDAISARLARRTGPMVISYRMNAGHVPHSHWTQQAEGGGRNIGEACHIYDLFTALTEAKATLINASAIGRSDERSSRNENFSVSITFSDGSLANLLYSSLGSSSWPKEGMEIYCDGQVYKLDDYRSATGSGEDRPLWKGQQDKGHKQELEALATALRSGKAWPIPLWQQLQATEISFEVERQIHHQSPTIQE